MEDFWTSKDSLNVIIGIVIGFDISYLTAYAYEWRTNKRRRNNLFNKYSFLESNENAFDWQHWNIQDGKIEQRPLDSYMMLKYNGEKSFSFKWKASSGEILGDGFIFWENLTQGKLSFYEYEKRWFDYRDVFHRRINHQGNEYDAIFVNADDQKTRYVMLRLV